MKCILDENGKIRVLNTPDCTVDVPADAIGTRLSCWSYDFDTETWSFDEVRNAEIEALESEPMDSI
jgi:hypothetical protein